MILNHFILTIIPPFIESKINTYLAITPREQPLDVRGRTSPQIGLIQVINIIILT